MILHLTIPEAFEVLEAIEGHPQFAVAYSKITSHGNAQMQDMDTVIRIPCESYGAKLIAECVGGEVGENLRRQWAAATIKDW